MSIPKIIYQTWKTKNLHENCIKIKNYIQSINPEYEMVLYDDDDIDLFIKTNFTEYVYNCFKQLNVGASKADFWRYCVLYKNGGVYLDMDSVILKPLNELIKTDDKCLITREGNPGIFNNWFMIFEKNHPILLKTIEKCCFNIINKISTDVCYITGPAGPFTDSINDTLIPLYGKNTHLYFESDTNLNNVFDNDKISIKCRFFGIDMNEFASWKHCYSDDLYKGHIYWRDEKKIFN